MNNSEETHPAIAKVKKAWESYAKSLGKKLTEVAIDSFSKLNSFMKNMQVWITAQLKGKLAGLKKQLDTAQNNLIELESSLGINESIPDLTKNFNQLMQASIKATPTPENIQKWEALGQALEDATQKEEAYRQALLQQYNEEAKYKEYMFKLNQQLQTQTTQIYTQLINGFTSLAQKSQNFIDNWFSSGYSANTSLKFYEKRYNQVKKQLNNAISNADISSAENYFSTLQTLANGLKNAATTQGNPEILQTILGSVYKDFSKYKDIFNDAKKITQVKIVGDDTGIAKNDVLKRLKTALDTYNKNIETKLGVNKKLNLKDFWTDKSLMNPADIRAFANILKPKTIGELNKYINILGNLRWSKDKFKYIESLNSKTIQKLQTILPQIGGNKEIYGLIKPVTGKNKNTLLDYVGGLFKKNALHDWDMEAALKAAFNAGAKNLLDAAKMIENVKPKVNWYDDNIDTWSEYVEKYGNGIDPNLLLAADWLHSNNGGSNAIDVVENWIKNDKLPKFATGGIVSSPTIGLIGEAGYAEAVIPMPKGHIPVKIKKDNTDLSLIKETNSILIQQTSIQKKMLRLMQKFDEEGIKCVS